MMIADILFEAAWKSIVVAACVVALLGAMKRQAPSSRVAVGGLGFAALLLLPAAVLTLAALPLPTLEFTAPPTAVALPQSLLSEAMVVPSAPAAAVESAYTPAQIAVGLWLAGALAMLARLAAGLVTLKRWTARASLVEFPVLNRIMTGGQVPEGTRLMVSDEVAAPLSFGWRRPVILIDSATLADLDHAEAVVAHEAAHLARGDWPRLIGAKTVVAFFWFNPFVWLLERLYLQDVEEAADAEATRLVDPPRYAQALLNVARKSVPAGANSIASGAIGRRIRKVLDGRAGSRWDRTWRVGALAGVAAIAGPIAIVQIAAPAVSSAHPTALQAPVAVAVPAEFGRAAIAPTVSPAVPRQLLPVRALVAPAPAAVAPSGAPATPVAVALVANGAVAVAPPAAVPDREEIERIRRASEEMRVQSQIIARDSARIAARARAEAAVAMASAKEGMLRGADEMDRGAISMREGAAKMREEARKLRDPAYRAKVIAEARANKGRWGNGKGDDHIPTDQELIDAIPKMEAGALKMDAGVEKMREGAARLRESAQRH